MYRGGRCQTTIRGTPALKSYGEPVENGRAAGERRGIKGRSELKRNKFVDVLWALAGILLATCLVAAGRR